MRSPFRSLAALLALFRYWHRHPLPSRDFPGTLGRFLRWQLGSRLLRMPVVVPWVQGTPLVVETGTLQPAMQAGPIFRRCGPISTLYTDGIHPYTAAGQACLAQAIEQALALRPVARF